MSTSNKRMSKLRTKLKTQRFTTNNLHIKEPRKQNQQSIKKEMNQNDNCDGSANNRECCRCRRTERCCTDVDDYVGFCGEGGYCQQRFYQPNTFIIYDQNGNSYVNSAASVSVCPPGFSGYGGIPSFIAPTVPAVLPFAIPYQSNYQIPYLPQQGTCQYPMFALPPSR
jgi:hypothetical protein